jgi:hypothetical protein
LIADTEKLSLRLCENRVLRGIFGPKRDEVTGEWRKLHNEELHDLYCSPTTVPVKKLRRMRWAGYVARMGRGEVCTGFWWENLRERPLGRLRRRWEDNIKIEVQEMGYRDMDWIELAQDRQVAWHCVCGNEPSGFIKCGEFLD